MTDAELTKLTLADAIRLIAQRNLSAQELTDAVMSRIQRFNPHMRSFITVIAPNTAGGPRSASAAARSLHDRPPLQGIPLTVKDLYDTKGIRTTAGSKVFEHRVPDQDATAVKKLKDAGALVIGKTNLHEFAYGVTTINPHYGVARNPWDSSRICGGSSGGSASAVALGMGLASLGSDTGGSIRIPAAMCGIVGLKPTYGRVSTRGVVPLAWSFDHAGPMTRTVEDAAILLEIISSYDPDDPYSRKVPVSRYTEALTGNIKSLRVGIPTNHFFENVAGPVEAAVRTAIRDLERLGADVVDVEVPDTSIHRAIWLQIASPEAYSFHEPYLQTQPELYGADVRGRLEAGRMLLSIDYVRAQRARTMMKENCKRLFETADVLVTPTVPVVAPRIEEAKSAARWLTQFTRYFNIVGLPAISIPCGFTAEGLPIGMQIIGKAFDEATVLRVAHTYEQDARWFERAPQI